MKCDKLKLYGMADPAIGDEYEMYKVTEVDEAIAELKDKLHDVDNQWNEQCKEIAELKSENEQLKAKLESVQASAYADSVDAGMRERRLKRALYKACANWALSTLAWLDCIDQGEPRKWSEMQQKCLKKAEEYK